MPPLGLEMGHKFSTNKALCSLGQRRSRATQAHHVDVAAPMTPPQALPNQSTIRMYYGLTNLNRHFLAKLSQIGIFIEILAELAEKAKSILYSISSVTAVYSKGCFC
ncbi:hypothetical protein AVEN_250470-1 [Araneus ventricosus]|uniref:Uncharacterized protein n=1 Tax=Araneus ventricosus TaxID=182803 RepID=A0A4Y2RXT7_ARAVE|nr:hypothetical protein AVEN_250470-1 [Araneus ventricosus]